MSLHGRDDFEALVASLPGTSLVEQWEAAVAKVGGKVFCLLGNNSASITFKVSEIAFEGLTASPGIDQAPYFAKGQWVNVERGALEEEMLRAYLTEAHRIISAKLTKKARVELGL